jgi:hypothetical protein
MRLELADWNHDGVMDLLLGNDQGYVVWYAGYHFAFSGIDAQPDRVLCLRWNSASLLRYQVLAGPTPDRAQTPIATNVPSGGAVTIWTNTGVEAARFYRVAIAP